MRRRTVQMIVVAVTIAVLILGVPMAIFGGIFVWENQRSDLANRANQVARIVERRLLDNEELDAEMVEALVGGEHQAFIMVTGPDGDEYRAGPELSGTVLREVQTTPSGARVQMDIPAGAVRIQVAEVVALIAAGATLALVVGVLVARHQARTLSKPLVYLAASAEQLGSGQARPRLERSGIEEIDLVSAELVRSAERVAGRLAAERQFAADASHQLRTPLTALSMRLEEIMLMAENDEVQEEARVSLEQLERLTGVVEDLLRTSRSNSGGTTEAVHLDQIFEQQSAEWTNAFKKAGRELVLDDAAGVPVLATPGSLAQVLATLIENSLKYGDGTTTVRTRTTGQGGGASVFIEISDEGEGVSDELAPDIFTKHVSGRSGTGLGLALAKDLVAADGGRLELVQRRPPIFQVLLNALPKSLDPDVVLPQGGLVTVGRRRRRR
ncbi:ATP-binding protein [Bogoriella caseilytica]|uniref:Signal transduction histidine-protein kinase/phosphatase MprB n=1 Tax=Bogoriella caseilytica TaxID=56055 RepID=A0A3N2BA31_9MICO|nr:ATP-binding protein [Bogoriella caseilytica]ROR72129.1 signal transduction histidine kinase [Bogoriella caseilytica]